MRSLYAIGMVLFIVLGLEFVASAKVNFNGTWIMDASRSIGQPAKSEQTLTVKQNDDKIQVEFNLKSTQGERILNDTYTIDGKETDFTPQVQPGSPPAKGKRIGSWLPRGNGFMISEETVAESPSGQVKTQVIRKWTLSPDGTTLTVDTYIDLPTASFETRRIFVKQ